MCNMSAAYSWVNLIIYQSCQKVVSIELHKLRGALLISLWVSIWDSVCMKTVLYVVCRVSAGHPIYSFCVVGPKMCYWHALFPKHSTELRWLTLMVALPWTFYCASTLWPNSSHANQAIPWYKEQSLNHLNYCSTYHIILLIPKKWKQNTRKSCILLLHSFDILDQFFSRTNTTWCTWHDQY